MNNFFRPFLITLIAGISTLLGSVLIFIKTKNINRIISSSLFFASGIMISISVIDLIPESFNYLFYEFGYFLTLIYIILFIIIGVILFILLTRFLDDNEDGLYKVGIYSFLAIVLHNVPEGIATFMVSSYDVKMGISLALAISMHNIPEGISISVPIYYSTKSRVKALFYTFISGISEPLGGVFAYFLLMNFINDIMMGYLFSFIAGIMLFIAMFELFPSAKSYDGSLKSYFYFFMGLVFMIIVHYLN